MSLKATSFSSGLTIVVVRQAIRGGRGRDGLSPSVILLLCSRVNSPYLETCHSRCRLLLVNVTSQYPLRAQPELCDQRTGAEINNNIN